MATISYPIAKKKKYAYEQIKKMIIENELPKGMPLVERRLVELLEVSRTPIREALRDLEEDGLVESIEGKGVFVKEMDYRDMVELFEVRMPLECTAVELFIERWDNVYFEQLREHMQRQEEAYIRQEHKIFMEEDMEIHYTFASGAQNSRLRNYIMSIYDQIRQLAISSRDDKEMRDLARAAHKKIFYAIEKRDKDAARKAMAEHNDAILNRHKEKFYLL